MAFKQFTECVKPEDFTDLSPEGVAGKIIIATGIVNVLALLALIVVAAITPVTSKPAILAGILMVIQIIIFLKWWLKGRLICLGTEEDTCAIVGVVKDHFLDEEFKGGDNDYTMNIFLAPGQENLIAPNAAITSIGRGYESSYQDNLHCEFEGDGIYSLLQYLLLIYTMLLVALALPFPADLILAILAFIVALIGGITQFRSAPNTPNPGSPTDVIEEGTLAIGDVVIVKGSWVYDSLHEGWNEIHPVKACQIILSGVDVNNIDWNAITVRNPTDDSEITLGTAENVALLKSSWCEYLKDAETAEENDNRLDSANDWVIHPSVDGCRKTPPPID